MMLETYQIMMVAINGDDVEDKSTLATEHDPPLSKNNFSRNNMMRHVLTCTNEHMSNIAS